MTGYADYKCHIRGLAWGSDSALDSSSQLTCLVLCAQVLLRGTQTPPSTMPGLLPWGAGERLAE